MASIYLGRAIQFLMFDDGNRTGWIRFIMMLNNGSLMRKSALDVSLYNPVNIRALGSPPLTSDVIRYLLAYS